MRQYQIITNTTTTYINDTSPITNIDNFRIETETDTDNSKRVTFLNDVICY